MLSEKIKEGRIALGLSQQEFADSLSVVRQTVSKWEKGLSLPDSGMILKISEVLGISVSELLCEEGGAESAPENGNVGSERAASSLPLLLVILGSPLWLPLLIAAAAVIIALLASLWAVVISFWAVFGSFVGSAVGFTAGGAVLCFTANGKAGLLLIAAGLLLAGSSIFAFFGARYLTKGAVKLSALPFALIKKHRKGGDRDEQN